MIKGTNKYEKLAESLQGIYTLGTLAEKLKVNRSKAIYVIHRLRKLGVVKTNYGAKKKRIYYISLKNKQRGISYTERINGVSPSVSYAIVVPVDAYYVHGRMPSYEESLIYAIKQRDVRYLIASLILFRKISDWSLLYSLAKKENLVREVCALYEIARRVVRKIKRMPKRFLNLAQKRKTKQFHYIVDRLSSDDFKDIKKRWKVYIPLNRADLEEYTK
jgi:DNA-binding MarR family transcriptional regulator